MKIITKNEKGTFNEAKKFAHLLEGGEVLALSGDLGAGKTIFTKGIAAQLGIKKNVNSPTFVIMKVYSTPKTKTTIKFLCHVDAYRLENPKELEVIGLNEYMGRSDTVTIIEWPEKIKSELPQYTQFIKITHQNDETREINIPELIKK